jgi:hypothetical protein
MMLRPADCAPSEATGNSHDQRWMVVMVMLLTIKETLQESLIVAWVFVLYGG